MKLAFMGISGSGKDYLSAYLVQDEGFSRHSFSDQLKKIAHNIYPWMDCDYSSYTKEKPLNIETKTGELISNSPREIWIHLNCLRKIENLIFIRMLESEIYQTYPDSENVNHKILISDIRSNEELLWCQKNNFKIIYIYRDTNVSAKYDIDKYITENKDKADFTFINNYDGIDNFQKFYEEHIKK